MFCRKRMVLIIIWSTLVLTACGNGEIEENDSYHQIEENPIKSESVMDIANTVVKQTRMLFAKQVKKETFPCAVKILLIGSLVQVVTFAIGLI